MKYEVTFDGVTKTYVALRHTAWHLLDVAKKHKEGSLLNFRAAAVFYAFAFEAYLNHVGAEEIPFWDDIDRISYLKKLIVIEKHLKLTPDHGTPPFQVIQELFKLRNALAHGRTRNIDLSYETDIPPEQDSSWRIHEWEILTAKKVDLYASSVTNAVEIINMSRSKPDKHVWNEGIRGRRVKIKQ